MVFANSINSFNDMVDVEAEVRIEGFVGSVAWGNNKKATYLGLLGIIVASGE